MVENPPAFPQNDWSFAGGDGREGMTLRDWFAGQVLAADGDTTRRDPSEMAKRAYKIAAAMLAERSK